MCIYGAEFGIYKFDVQERRKESSTHAAELGMATGADAYE